VSRPLILVVGHRREVDSPLGRQRACVVYEGYLEHLDRAGAQSIVGWPGGSWGDDVLNVVDGVLLVGGGDVDPTRFGSRAHGDAMDAARDDFEFALVRTCRDRSVPLLGMCRGAQAMNVALGGSLKESVGHRQDLPLASPTHPISLEDGSQLARMFGAAEIAVNSFHRWAVDRPGQGLAVSAVTSDDSVEGIESTSDWWATGIQWHAELLDDDRGSALFRGFVADVQGAKS
jgi:putative glutamine amidotransferase